jgi:hypothetical protein
MERPKGGLTVILKERIEVSEERRRDVGIRGGSVEHEVVVEEYGGDV